MRARAIPAVAAPARWAGWADLPGAAARFLPELLLALFCLANLAWVAMWQGMEALPVHFIFISVSLVFGLRMWSVRSSLLALAAVSVPTFLLVVRAIEAGPRRGRHRARRGPADGVAVPRHGVARAQAAGGGRARAGVFGNASHELMTPLTIAWGELELLGRDGATPTLEEIRETRRVVLEELQRGRVLAAGLLTLSRLDAGAIAQRSLVPPDDLLDGAVQRWSRVTNRPLVVVAHVGGEVSCVRQDIALLLDNLIENALRHTPDGSPVTLSARARGRHLVLEVSDQGNGIADDALPYIFDRFYRARSADGTRGSGLGLAIVKAIAETHGGGVGVDSELGAGTTFRVELPGFEHERGERLTPLLV